MALGKSSSEAVSRWPGQIYPGEVPSHNMKLGTLVVLLSVTLFCGLTPLCFVRGAGRCNIYSERRHRVMSLLSCFAGGVFFATCLLDLVPGYLSRINEAFSSLDITLLFPLPEFIIAMGFFLVLVLEQIVLALKSQSSSLSEIRRALLVDPSAQLIDRDGRRHSCDKEDIEGEGSYLHVDFNITSAIRAFNLVFTLSMHSIFEGLAVGLQKNSQEVMEICYGLLLHKSIISFSLALKLTQSKLRRGVVVGCLLLFAVMSPLGIGLGATHAKIKWSPQHQLAKSTLEGLASGAFMYITFVDILPHELSPPKNRMPKVAMLLTGFAVITAVLFMKM